jgi:glyoxylase-like metal-dependent hydrolase (beta-lactamase superfamily II)
VTFPDSSELAATGSRRLTERRLLPRFLNEDHDRALTSLEKIEPANARWVLPGHGLPWEGSPQQAVKLARQIAARTNTRQDSSCPTAARYDARAGSCGW